MDDPRRHFVMVGRLSACLSNLKDSQPTSEWRQRLTELVDSEARSRVDLAAEHVRWWWCSQDGRSIEPGPDHRWAWVELGQEPIDGGPLVALPTVPDTVRKLWAT